MGRARNSLRYTSNRDYVTPEIATVAPPGDAGAERTSSRSPFAALGSSRNGAGTTTLHEQTICSQPHRALRRGSRSPLQLVERFSFRASSASGRRAPHFGRRSDPRPRRGRRSVLPRETPDVAPVRSPPRGATRRTGERPLRRPRSPSQPSPVEESVAQALEGERRRHHLPDRLRPLGQHAHRELCAADECHCEDDRTSYGYGALEHDRRGQPQGSRSEQRPPQ